MTSMVMSMVMAGTLRVTVISLPLHRLARIGFVVLIVVLILAQLVAAAAAAITIIEDEDFFSKIASAPTQRRVHALRIHPYPIAARELWRPSVSQSSTQHSREEGAQSHSQEIPVPLRFRAEAERPTWHVGARTPAIAVASLFSGELAAISAVALAAAAAAVVVRLRRDTAP